MYGEAAYAETSYASSIQLAAPIIVEIGLETRELIIAIELDLITLVVTDGTSYVAEGYVAGGYVV